MSKLRLEELESRYLLSNSSLSPVLASPLLPLSGAGASIAPDHANLVQPGANLGQMGPTQSSVPIASVADPRVNGSQATTTVLLSSDAGRLSAVETWNSGSVAFVQPPRFAGAVVDGDLAGWSRAGLPSIVIIEFIPVSFEFTTSFEAQRLAPQLVGNGVTAAPAEHIPANFVSAGANPPLSSGFEIAAPVADFSAQAAHASFGPLSFLMVGVGAGALYSTNGSQPPTAPQFAGNPTSSESTGPMGTQAQALLTAPSSASTPGLATTPLLAESRIADAYGILPRVLPFLELGPQGQQEVFLPELDLSALKAGLSQFMAVLGPQGQRAISLPPPDLAALEAGLRQFLTDLGETSSQLVIGPDHAALRTWLFAAAGAGAACALAYRQQRRYARRNDAEILCLPGCSLDDVF